MMEDRRVGVAGLGSPHGDDAGGWLEIDLLRQERLPASVTLHKLRGGHEILDLLEGIDELILIDAVASEGQPGQIHELTWPDPRIDQMRAASTHLLDVAQALELAVAVGLPASRVVLFGIEPRSARPAAGPSDVLIAALPVLVQRIVRFLTVRQAGPGHEA
jgi:hydrogenase maturation protease